MMKNTVFRAQLNGMALVATLLWPVLPRAQGSTDVFVCVDPSGTRVYQNTQTGEQCRPIAGSPVLTVPQPGGRRGAGQGDSAAGSAAVGSTAGSASGSAQSGSSGGASATGSGASPWAGSRVDQQAREQDRLRILESEMRDEENRLASLQQRQQAAGSDPRLMQDIARSQASLDALRREIAKVRRP